MFYPIAWTIFVCLFTGFILFLIDDLRTNGMYFKDWREADENLEIPQEPCIVKTVHPAASGTNPKIRDFTTYNINRRSA